MAALAHSVDPTLAALDALHAQASSDTPRPYLGASAIGNPCSRALWYGFRHTTTEHNPAANYRAIQDGHRGEPLMAQWLRSLPGIQLWTENPDEPGKQIGFVDLHGHFRGHLDGVIQGLYQAPQTPHVWDHKVTKELKFNKLIRLMQKLGEKNALAEWDEVYFAQAQIYMHEMELTRHYLTVATPGNRAIVSCRTAYQPKVAKAILKKAETIITAERPPLKLSDNPAWWQCKFCDHTALCHGQAMPQVNCRTCAHSTATLDGDAAWQCEHHHKPLDIAAQHAACPNHVWHPDLLANHAEAIGANPKTGAITFKRKDGTTVEIGLNATASRQMLADSVPAPAAPAPLEDEVLIELATDSAIPAETLLAGDLEDGDWGKLTSAVSQFWDRWKGDEPKLARLRNLIEVIDSAYVGIMDAAEQRRAA